MPYLKLQTNQELSKDRKQDLLEDIVSLVSKELEKPKKYVMALIEESQMMIFGSSYEPTAYVEFRSINLPEKRTQALSKSITHFIKSHLDIDASRIFIQFVNSERHMWGFNASTF